MSVTDRYGLLRMGVTDTIVEISTNVTDVTDTFNFFIKIKKKILFENIKNIYNIGVYP